MKIIKFVGKFGELKKLNFKFTNHNSIKYFADEVNSPIIIFKSGRNIDLSEIKNPHYVPIVELLMKNNNISTPHKSKKMDKNKKMDEWEDIIHYFNTIKISNGVASLVSFKEYSNFLNQHHTYSPYENIDYYYCLDDKLCSYLRALVDNDMLEIQEQ